MQNNKIPFAIKFNVYYVIIPAFFLLIVLIMLPTISKESDLYNSFLYLTEGTMRIVNNILIILEALIVGYFYFVNKDIRKVVKVIITFTIIFIFLIFLQTDFSDTDDLFGSVISIFFEAAPVVWMVVSKDVRQYIGWQ